jgi:hypothetical protein
VLLNFKVSRLGQEHDLQGFAEAFRETDPEVFKRAETKVARCGHQYTQVPVGGIAIWIISL